MICIRHAGIHPKGKGERKVQVKVNDSRLHGQQKPGAEKGVGCGKYSGVSPLFMVIDDVIWARRIAPYVVSMRTFFRGTRLTAAYAKNGGFFFSFLFGTAKTKGTIRVWESWVDVKEYWVGENVSRRPRK